MSYDEKVRENRARRAAERQGLKLEKSRRRDPRALEFGTYRLVHEKTKTIVAGNRPQGYGFDLDAIEAVLEGRRGDA
jgi:hypothetical protein